VKLTSNQCRI